MDFVLGLIIGYIIVTICESLFHKIIGHASLDMRDFWRDFLPFSLYKQLNNAWYGHHVVHHQYTFVKDHNKVFDNIEDRNFMNENLDAYGYDYHTTNYGLVPGSEVSSALKFITPTLITMISIFTILSIIFGVTYSFLFILGLSVPLYLMYWVSQYMHPLLHMETNDALSQLPWILKNFVGKKYFRYIAKYHWVHHQNDDCNFNLLPGGDIILGVCEIPN